MNGVGLYPHLRVRRVRDAAVVGCTHGYARVIPLEPSTTVARLEAELAAARDDHARLYGATAGVGVEP